LQTIRNKSKIESLYIVGGQTAIMRVPIRAHRTVQIREPQGGAVKFKLLTLSLTLILILALAPAALADDDPNGEPNAFCADLVGRQHPVGNRIAQVYSVEYEDLMDWFCKGNYGFGQILLALQTSQFVEYTPGDLLIMKSEKGGWGLVWQEFGFTGKPKADRPAGGPPAWAGPEGDDDEDLDGGPPPWAGPKFKDWKSGKGGPPPWAGPKDKILPDE
jgi:hypothetical protein